MELVSRQPRIVAIGEGMLELTREGDAWRIGYGGDVLNTAIHLARFGRSVSFISALGQDAFSRNLRKAWASEGLNVAHVLTDPTRHAGLYAIDTDAEGERSFTYWRSDSAARQLISLPGWEEARVLAEGADLLYISLVSLAVLTWAGRRRLIDLCDAVRERGGHVAFDSNYRPRLWESASEARHSAIATMRKSSIGLPSFDDDSLLFGDGAPEATAARWTAEGVTEVAVKMGARGSLVRCGDTESRIPITPEPAIDTSGAGDAFNAGYIDAWLTGAEAAGCALAGSRLAAWVAQRPGALPMRENQAYSR